MDGGQAEGGEGFDERAAPRLLVSRTTLKERVHLSIGSSDAVIVVASTRASVSALLCARWVLTVPREPH